MVIGMVNVLYLVFMLTLEDRCYILAKKIGSEFLHEGLQSVKILSAGLFSVQVAFVGLGPNRASNCAFQS